MSVKFVTPEAIASYVHVFSPSETPSGTMKYSVSLLFPKDKTDMGPLKEAIKQAATEKWAKKIPKDIRNPIRDGDEKTQEEYHGHWFINANASEEYRPKVVALPDLQPIIDTAEFYSGCVCRASINLYGYDTAGNKGIGAGLNSLMKVRDGDPLGNASTPEIDFADFKADIESSNDNDLGF